MIVPWSESPLTLSFFSPTLRLAALAAAALGDAAVAAEVPAGARCPSVELFRTSVDAAGLLGLGEVDIAHAHQERANGRERGGGGGTGSRGAVESVRGGVCPSQCVCVVVWVLVCVRRFVRLAVRWSALRALGRVSAEITTHTAREIEDYSKQNNTQRADTQTIRRCDGDRTHRAMHADATSKCKRQRIYAPPPAQPHQQTAAGTPACARLHGHNAVHTTQAVASAECTGRTSSGVGRAADSVEGSTAAEASRASSRGSHSHYEHQMDARNLRSSNSSPAQHPVGRLTQQQQLCSMSSGSYDDLLSSISGANAGGSQPAVRLVQKPLWSRPVLCPRLRLPPRTF